MSRRSAGSSLLFYDCKSEGVTIQVLCDAKESSGPSFAEQHEHLRRGDWIGIIGFSGRTKPKSRDVGELSIIARQVVLLTPCLYQLPSQHYGFKDLETRHRQKYLDYLMNDSSRRNIVTRAKIIKFVRQFLDNRDFLEV
jgi:lysyl-tRNA synthetase, class II